MSGHRLIESWKVAAYLQIPGSALLVVLIARARIMQEIRIRVDWGSEKMP